MEYAQQDGRIDKSTIVIDNFDREPLWFDDEVLRKFTYQWCSPMVDRIPGLRWWEVDERRRMDRDDNITGDFQRAWSYYWAIRYGTQQGGIVLELGSSAVIGPATLGVDKHCGVSPDVERYGKDYGFPHMQCDCNEPLPFFDDKFEAVTSNHVLEHLVSPGAVIKECLRVVKQYGIVAHLQPDMAYNARSVFDAHGQFHGLDPTHVSEHSADEFLELIYRLQANPDVPAFDIVSHASIQTHFSFETVLRKR